MTLKSTCSIAAATALMLSSCMTTKTSIGNYDDSSRAPRRTYAKGKQVWLFWGIAPLGRTNVSTPDDGNCQVVTRRNFGDVLVTGLTGGLVMTHSIKVNINETSAERTGNGALSEARKALRTQLEHGSPVVAKRGARVYEGIVVAAQSDEVLVKYFEGGEAVIKGFPYEGVTLLDVASAVSKRD